MACAMGTKVLHGGVELDRTPPEDFEEIVTDSVPDATCETDNMSENGGSESELFGCV